MISHEMVGVNSLHREKVKPLVLEEVRLRQVLSIVTSIVKNKQAQARGIYTVKWKFAEITHAYHELAPDMKSPVACTFCYSLYDFDLYPLKPINHHRYCPICLELELDQLAPDDIETPRPRLYSEDEQLLRRAIEIMEQLKPDPPVIEEEPTEPAPAEEDEQNYEEDEEGHVINPETGEPFPEIRQDNTTGVYWLWFPDKPDAEIRYAIKKLKWQYRTTITGRKQWKNVNLFAKLPDNFKYVDMGMCDYSHERAGNLMMAADRSIERAEREAERSDQIIGHGLSGGVLIRGHRAGRKQQKVKEQAERAASKAEEYYEKSDRYERKSHRSEAYIAQKERPDVIQRRIERWEADIRSTEKSIDVHIIDSLVNSPNDSYYQSPEKMQAYINDAKRRIAVLQREIARAKDHLQLAGGLAIDKVTIEPGDLVQFRGWGTYKVAKVNKKTISVLDTYDRRAVPDEEKCWFTRNIDKTEFLRIVRKADGTWVEQEEQAQKEVPPIPPIPKRQQRLFKVHDITEVYVDSRNSTALYPTTGPVAERLFNTYGYLLPDRIGTLFDPQGGTGAFLKFTQQYCQLQDIPIANIRTCEILWNLQQHLRKMGYQVEECGDFLDLPAEEIADVIVSNPPFAVPGMRWAWLPHMRHALKFLKEGGTFLGIVPNSFLFEDPAISEFREYVEEHGEYMQLERGLFNESGTSIPCIIFGLTK